MEMEEEKNSGVEDKSQFSPSDESALSVSNSEETMNVAEKTSLNGNSESKETSQPKYVNAKYSVAPPAVPLSDTKISYRGDEYEKPLSIGHWVLTLFLLAFPIVNLIFFIYWLATDGNTGRKNYLIASLIWGVIESVLGIILFVLLIVLVLKSIPEQPVEMFLLLKIFY